MQMIIFFKHRKDIWSSSLGSPSGRSSVIGFSYSSAVGTSSRYSIVEDLAFNSISVK